MAEIFANIVFGLFCLVMLYVIIITLLDWANVRYEVHRCGCVRIEQNPDDGEYWRSERLCARHVRELLGGPHIENARIIVTTLREKYHG